MNLTARLSHNLTHHAATSASRIARSTSARMLGLYYMLSFEYFTAIRAPLSVNPVQHVVVGPGVEQELTGLEHALVAGLASEPHALHTLLPVFENLGPTLPKPLRETDSMWYWNAFCIIACGRSRLKMCF
ncbi:hypothetical protein CTA1_12876 [Colletotrichum tanaceti]|uniref:Uncharacterized protein n=1 Tax=Colletotrichum tanaceti TaxID=1306861 RepID=A0A4U6XEX3_9PEZI|nr:hypothetical protein CTA1_12876 [Colletotrichum tanaceti]